MNPFEILKNINTLKDSAKNMQENLKHISEEGNAGGGLVKVKMNGTFEITQIELDEVAVDKRDIPMLQTLLMSALNDAHSKVKDKVMNNPELSGIMNQFKGVNN